MKKITITITLLIALVGSAFALDEAKIIAERAKNYAERTEKIERRYEEQKEWLAHPEMQEYLDFIIQEKESQTKLYKFLETGDWK